MGRPRGNPGLDVEELLSPGAGREEAGKIPETRRKEDVISPACRGVVSFSGSKQPALGRPGPRSPPEFCRRSESAKSYPYHGEQLAAGGLGQPPGREPGAGRRRVRRANRRCRHTGSDSFLSPVKTCVCLHNTCSSFWQ